MVRQIVPDSRGIKIGEAKEMRKQSQSLRLTHSREEPPDPALQMLRPCRSRPVKSAFTEAGGGVGRCVWSRRGRFAVMNTPMTMAMDTTMAAEPSNGLSW